jgi:hypothetical protein
MSNLASWTSSKKVLTLYRMHQTGNHVITRLHLLSCRVLLPFCFLFSVIASIDRANLGFASIDLTTELGLSPQDYGLGAGIFFLSYSLFQVGAIKQLVVVTEDI